MKAPLTLKDDLVTVLDQRTASNLTGKATGKDLDVLMNILQNWIGLFPAFLPGIRA